MDRRHFLKGAVPAGVSVAMSSTLLSQAGASWVEKNSFKSEPSGDRMVATKGFATYPPLFVKNARTLDPVEMARECWKGYLTKQPDPWGMLPSLQPTLRFNFDNRALPWPDLKHHNVDGFDNNARNVGAHALLHAMLGEEKKNDPAEIGEIGYLLSITDPVSGFAYGTDVLPRECPLGEGEMAKNLMLLYEQTRQQQLWTWAEKMTKTLRLYASLERRPGLGLVAFYNQGGRGGQGGFVIGEPPVKIAKDATLEGWQYLYVGWSLGAISKWYELTGDSPALEFAAALANRLCHGEDANGNDGSLRTDGSFGGNSQAALGSGHMHGHTHCLPGLIHFGNQLIAAGQLEKGVEMIEQARRTFDWLYDPSRNTEAGSLTGWLGEWLMRVTGWPRKADCEGCTMGDVVQTAVGLGAASRRNGRLASLVSYYDRAEQIFTGQLVEQMFRPKTRYLEVVRDCLDRRVAKEMESASGESRRQEVERRYAKAVHTAERMVGQQMGLCGFPDWVNQLPSDLDKELPGIHMQSCCADATIRAAHAIWSETVTGTEEEARVNLAFNRVSPWVEVVSCLPHRGEVNVVVKNTRRVLVRVPEWGPKDQVKAFRDRKATDVKWAGSYVIFEGLTRGEQLTVTYPLWLWEVKEKMQGVEYTERWRGNTIVDISPPGKWIPMYQRPELEREQMA